MLYCVANARYPVEYISSGNLISEDGFLHDRRNLDSWVFIVVQKGTLHIAQNEQTFDVHENETLLLFPNQTHYGYKKCEGYLSYYWVHFYMTDPHYTIYSRKTLLRHGHFLYDTFTPPPEKIFCQLMTILFYRNAVGFLTKSVPFCSFRSFSICPSAIITSRPGAAAMR